MIDIKIINKSNNPLPVYATKGSAGLDLMANLPTCLTLANSTALEDELHKSLRGFGIELIQRQMSDSINKELIIKLLPNGRILVPTGLYISIPTGYKADVKSRSGMALKAGVSVANADGLIDEDYRGEVGVILINHSTEPFLIKNGDKIAQLVITKYEKANLIKVDNLDETERGEGGFGSTDRPITRFA